MPISYLDMLHGAPRAEFSQWTRVHDDTVRVACDLAESQAPLKYITYAPTYLTEDSCSVGANNNCEVFGPQRVAHEPRIGKPTNLRILNRPVTQYDRLVGGPNKTSASAYVPIETIYDSSTPNEGIPRGGLLSESMIDTRSTFYQPDTFYKQCDVNVAGAPVTHHLDQTIELSRPQPDTAGRITELGRVYQSTRADRRNLWTSETRGGHCSQRPAA